MRGSEERGSKRMSQESGGEGKGGKKGGKRSGVGRSGSCGVCVRCERHRGGIIALIKYRYMDC